MVNRPTGGHTGRDGYTLATSPVPLVFRDEAVGLLVLAGGSNVVIGDDGYPGTVVLLRSTGIRDEPGGDGETTARPHLAPGLTRGGRHAIARVSPRTGS